MLLTRGLPLRFAASRCQLPLLMLFRYVCCCRGRHRCLLRYDAKMPMLPRHVFDADTPDAMLRFTIRSRRLLYAHATGARLPCAALLTLPLFRHTLTLLTPADADMLLHAAAQLPIATRYAMLLFHFLLSFRCRFCRCSPLLMAIYAICRHADTC